MICTREACFELATHETYSRLMEGWEPVCEGCATGLHATGETVRPRRRKA